MQIISHKLEEIDQLKCKDIIIFICDGCGKNCGKTQQKIIQSIRYRKQDRLYCNSKCFSESHKSSIKCNCGECGKEFTKQKSAYYQKSNRHYILIY
jgi:ABC-type multidrug transport system ATPase subunit